MFLEYKKSFYLRKNTVFLLNRFFLTLPVTSQPPFPALCVPKNIENSSVAIGSVLAWGSNITMKYRLKLFSHDIEYIYTNKRQNVIFSVPRL